MNRPRQNKLLYAQPVRAQSKVRRATPVRCGAAALAIVSLLGVGCASRPFKIKPRPLNPPNESEAHAAAGGLEIHAGPIRDEDLLYDTFNANLIEAGILPIKVSVKNSGTEPYDVKAARFWLEVGGRLQKPIKPERAFKRLMAYYEIRLYNPHGYKASLADFVSYDFQSTSLLEPGGTRWGLIFFENPPGMTSQRDLVLAIKGIGPADLRLNLE